MADEVLTAVAKDVIRQRRRAAASAESFGATGVLEIRSVNLRRRLLPKEWAMLGFDNE